MATGRKAAAAEMIRLMNKYPGRSTGKRWTREEEMGLEEVFLRVTKGETQ